MTDSLEAYRLQARAWLTEYQSEFGADARRGLSEAEDLALGRRWQQIKFEAGYAGIAWKKEYGGCGLSELKAVIFAEEEMPLGFPTQYFGVSLGQPVDIAWAALYLCSDEASWVTAADFRVDGGATAW